MTSSAPNIQHWYQVAKIRSFKNKSKGVRHTKVNVFWFYRPEECKAGRRVSTEFTEPCPYEKERA